MNDKMKKITYNIDVLSKVEYIPMQESTTFKIYEKYIIKKYFFKPNEEYMIYFISFAESYGLKSTYTNKTELLNDIIQKFNDEFVLINSIIYRKPKIVFYQGSSFLDSFIFDTNDEAIKNYEEVKSKMKNIKTYEK